MAYTSDGRYYDENKDYSLAIKNATSDEEIKQLQSERQNKIDDVYGGKDPYTTPTVNSTTGKATTPTNTASKYYGSDWTPQTATVDKNVEYNALQGVEYTPAPVVKEPVAQQPTLQDPKTALYDYLQQWFTSAQEQAKLSADYAVNKGVTDLQRAEQDAQAQFQSQRNQIDIEEARAKDNQALYAERRGDKGGIGASQYDSIMNTAAQNRLSVSQAQTKLATDTARQIADLRAQGEFEKADALLQLSQQYLSQLISMEQWAAEYNLSVAQFQEALKQWDAEFLMAESDITGMYKGNATLAYQKNLADQGWAMLAAGVPPTASQLSAMGMTAEQAQSYITAQRLAAQGNGGNDGAVTGNPSGDAIYREMYDAGITDYAGAIAYLTGPKGAYYKQDDMAAEIAEYYLEKYASGALLSSAEKTLKANGMTMNDVDFTDSLGRERIKNQYSQRDGEKKYFVSGVGWLGEQEIINGLYGNQLDFILDPKDKNKFTIVEVVTR